MTDQDTEEFIPEGRDEKITLNTYLSLRDGAQDPDPPIWQMFASTLNGIEHAFQIDEECKALDIAIMDYLGTLDGDVSAMDKLCLQTLRAISKREKLTAEDTSSHLISRGVVISDKLVNLFVCVVLESAAYHELTPPNSFHFLVFYHLGRLSPKSPYTEAVTVKGKQFMAATFINENPALTLGEVSRALKIDKSQLSRWKKDPEFQGILKLVKDAE